MITKHNVFLSAVVVFLFAATVANAQEFPVRAVRIIVPSSPGGGTDILARQLAAKLTERWGQQVVVDNRPGAGQMIGISLVAKSPPDGYTVVMTATPLALNTALYKKVPYDPIRDFAPVNAISGHVQLLMSTLLPPLPHLKSGRLRALGVTSAKRVSSLPDVPAIAEGGAPGYDVVGWYGVAVPAGTPQPVVAKLNADFVAAIHTPEIRERLAADGAEAVGSKPEEFGALIKSEIERWSKVVEVAKIPKE